MSVWIRGERLTAALNSLAEWRRRARSQAAMHLWPLLALIEKGVNTRTPVAFTEGDDFSFWDRHFRFPGDERAPKTADGSFTPAYYIEPLLLEAKPYDYPHRGPWTIRTRTFLNAWRAATFDESRNTWVLKGDYATTFVQRVLRKEEVVQRVRVVDLAVWLLRDRVFPDGASARSIEEEFRRTFPFASADYDAIFEFIDEDPAIAFQEHKPADEALRASIEAVLVSPEAQPRPVPRTPACMDSWDPLPDDDPVLIEVQRLRKLGTSGIIFRGCPGTSKTWYAKQIARRLTVSPSDIFEVQFHPSYGYEDLIEGYVPDESTKSGFRLADKVFLDACATASKTTTPVVFIIDEINRGDPARIFGELLTYVEYGYRGLTYRLPYSGRAMSVPENLILLGTMNQYDRSITQLDLALVRRLDQIDLRPSSETVEAFLRSSEFPDEQIDDVVQWFEKLQTILPGNTGGIGHTYLKDVHRPDELETVWRYRMLPYCEAVLEFDPQRLEHAKRSFDALYRALLGQPRVDQ
jgi:hypothetical protein